VLALAGSVRRQAGTGTGSRATTTVEHDSGGLIRLALYRASPYAFFLAGAVFLLNGLWASPAGRMLLDNYYDQVQFEWFLTNAANAIFHGENPLFTYKLNAPTGVNLMANTSVLALAIPLAPVTLIFGADVTFVLIETLALAGTASAWFFVLNRLLHRRMAALVGATFCGFAPAMVSQAAGHPNIAAQFLLPFFVLVVFRLGDPAGGHVVRGLVLAGLVIVQAFINEEVLLLTALALGVFVLGYAASARRNVVARIPAAMRSLATTALVAGAVLAYPLYHQFFGSGSYRGLPWYILNFGTDLASYWSFARRSVAGDAAIAGRLAQGPTEENSFFGWPLLVLLVFVFFWLRRNAVVRALAVTGLVFVILSLGSAPRLGGRNLDVVAPWGWLDALPLFNSVVPTRLALVVTPAVGCILAIAVARYAETTRGVQSGPVDKSIHLRRATGALLLAIALVPLTPTPLPTFERPLVPAFFTAGTYGDHIPHNGVVLAIPPGGFPVLSAMQWQTATDLDFAIFGGYFLAPEPGNPQRTAMFGPAYPPTMAMLAYAAQQDGIFEVTPGVRERATADLLAIGATTLVMPAHYSKAARLRMIIDQIVGAGQLVGDVWVWDIALSPDDGSEDAPGGG